MSDGPMAGKSALVTAGSRGIGRAVAERLAADGAAVAVNYRANRDAADETVAAITGRGGRATALAADATDPVQVREPFAAADTALGGLDVVVLAAGVPRDVATADASDADLRETFVAITRGAYVALQEAARRVRDGGRVVVISSGAAVVPMATGGLYAAAKAAIDQFAFALAKEIGSRHVTVNAVMPGLTRTEGLILPQEQLDAMVSQTPLGRLGEPSEVCRGCGVPLPARTGLG